MFVFLAFLLRTVTSFLYVRIAGSFIYKRYNPRTMTSKESVAQLDEFGSNSSIGSIESFIDGLELDDADEAFIGSHNNEPNEAASNAVAARIAPAGNQSASLRCTANGSFVKAASKADIPPRFQNKTYAASAKSLPRLNESSTTKHNLANGQSSIADSVPKLIIRDIPAHVDREIIYAAVQKFGPINKFFLEPDNAFATVQFHVRRDADGLLAAAAHGGWKPFGSTAPLSVSLVGAAAVSPDAMPKAPGCKYYWNDRFDVQHFAFVKDVWPEFDPVAQLYVSRIPLTYSPDKVAHVLKDYAQIQQLHFSMDSKLPGGTATVDCADWQSYERLLSLGPTFRPSRDPQTSLQIDMSYNAKNSLTLYIQGVFTAAELFNCFKRFGCICIPPGINVRSSVRSGGGSVAFLPFCHPASFYNLAKFLERNGDIVLNGQPLLLNPYRYAKVVLGPPNYRCANNDNRPMPQPESSGTQQASTNVSAGVSSEPKQVGKRKYFCKPCKKQLNSKLQFDAHVAGKLHEFVVQGLDESAKEEEEDAADCDGESSESSECCNEEDEEAVKRPAPENIVQSATPDASALQPESSAPYAATARDISTPKETLRVPPVSILSFSPFECIVTCARSVLEFYVQRKDSDDIVLLDLCSRLAETYPHVESISPCDILERGEYVCWDSGDAVGSAAATASWRRARLAKFDESKGMLYFRCLDTGLPFCVSLDCLQRIKPLLNQFLQPRLCYRCRLSEEVHPGFTASKTDTQRLCDFVFRPSGVLKIAVLSTFDRSGKLPVTIWRETSSANGSKCKDLFAIADGAAALDTSMESRVFEPIAEVYVSGIPEQIHRDTVHEYFKGFGNIKQILFEPGDATITFAHWDSVQVVLEKSEDGELSLPFNDSRQLTQLTAELSDSAWSSLQIFVGGIPADADEQIVYETFYHFGEIEPTCGVQLRRGSHFQFAFVTFTAPSFVREALRYAKSHRIEIGRKCLDVRPYDPEFEANSQRHSSGNKAPPRFRRVAAEPPAKHRYESASPNDGASPVSGVGSASATPSLACAPPTASAAATTATPTADAQTTINAGRETCQQPPLATAATVANTQSSSEASTILKPRLSAAALSDVSVSPAAATSSAVVQFRNITQISSPKTFLNYIQNKRSGGGPLKSADSLSFNVDWNWATVEFAESSTAYRVLSQPSLKLEGIRIYASSLPPLAPNLLLLSDFPPHCTINVLSDYLEARSKTDVAQSRFSRCGRRALFQFVAPFDLQALLAAMRSRPLRLSDGVNCVPTTSRVPHADAVVVRNLPPEACVNEEALLNAVEAYGGIRHVVLDAAQRQALLIFEDYKAVPSFLDQPFVFRALQCPEPLPVHVYFDAVDHFCFN